MKIVAKLVTLLASVSIGAVLSAEVPAEADSPEALIVVDVTEDSDLDIPMDEQDEGEIYLYESMVRRRLHHYWGGGHGGFGYSTILDFVVKNGRFSTLERLLVIAGLDEALGVTVDEDTGEDVELTLLAPTNQAFAKLPPALVDFLVDVDNLEILQAVLLYHVMLGKNLRRDLPVGQTEGVDNLYSFLSEDDTQTLSFEKRCRWHYWGWYTVCSISVDDGSAYVIRGDLHATNGAIQVVNGVLVPPILREAVMTFF